MLTIYIAYSSWDLNDNVKFGTIGIYCYNTSSLAINATVVEEITNGISCLSSTMSLTSIHIESLVFYGIIIGIGNNTQLIADQVYFLSMMAAFYFGKYAMAILNTILHAHAAPSCVDQLFVYDSSSGRNITFTNTIYHTRSYTPDILFTDEGVNGQNYGAVYINAVDPIGSGLGSDTNYGFSPQDALLTFDAALIRIQNQSSKNPVKIIYVKAALPISEGVTAQTGAATKDLTTKSLSNVDILITSYGIDNLHPRGRIFFSGDTSPMKVAMIGQIQLLGNINLYFRDIDLICNTPLAMPANPTNMTIFGLVTSYARLTFNSERMTNAPIPYDIDLGAPYSLIETYLPLIMASTPRALIDVKFVTVSIQGGSLSPMQYGGMNLAVDCVQVGSTRTGLGWQDAQIIRNNF